MSNCKNAFDYPTNEKERNIKEIIEKSFEFKPGDKVYWVDLKTLHGLNDCSCHHGIAVVTLADGNKYEIDCPLCKSRRESITLYEPVIRSGIVTNIEFKGGYSDCKWYSLDTGDGAGMWTLYCSYKVRCDDDENQEANLTMGNIKTLEEAQELYEMHMKDYNKHLKAIRLCVDVCGCFDECEIKNSNSCPCVDCSSFDGCDMKASSYCPCVDCEHFYSCSHSEGSC